MSSDLVKKLDPEIICSDPTHCHGFFSFSRASSPGGSRPKDGKGKEQSKTAQKERREDPKQKERKEEPKQKEPVKFALPKNQVN